MAPGLPDFSKRACRWKTLTVSPKGIAALPRLPLAGLERVSVRGSDARPKLPAPKPDPWASDDDEDPPNSAPAPDRRAETAGMDVLKRLHAQGRLALGPAPDVLLTERRRWLLSPGDGLFYLPELGNEELLDLVRVLAEAGQGVNALVVDASTFNLDELEYDLGPLLQQRADAGGGGGVTALCTCLRFCDEDEDDEGWWWGLLGSLPDAVTQVTVRVAEKDAGRVAGYLLALVNGGVEALRRRLALTVLHSGQVRSKLEKDLARGASRSLLTLKVARTEWKG